MPHPGALTAVVQVFSSVNVVPISLQMQLSPHDAGRADVQVRLLVSERTCDLICRKLQRLIEVVTVEDECLDRSLLRDTG
jgi:acetolactate synthase regulatory subunit